MEQTDALLKSLLQEEADLQFTEFTNNTAYQVGTRIIEKAFRESKNIVVNIQKDGELLFYARMNGTNEGNDQWVNWKNNVVHHFKHSSYYMHVYLRSIGASVEAHNLDPENNKAEGGSFPLIVKNAGIAGTITVSGLSGDQDHAMITSILHEYLNV